MSKRQNYVTFLSPGTFFHEDSTEPIENWDIEAAIKLSKDVIERYGAKPFGFYFTTMLTADPIPDGEGGTLKVTPKEVARSQGTYFLGGVVENYDTVKERADPKESILRSNMECNNFAFIITNTNSWKSVHPFGEADIVVDPGNGQILKRGDASEYIRYRADLKARFQKDSLQRSQ